MKDLFNDLNSAIEYAKKVEAIMNGFHKNGVQLLYKGGTSSLCAAAKKIIAAKLTMVTIDLHDDKEVMNKLRSQTANPGTGWQKTFNELEYTYMRATNSGHYKLYLRVLISQEVSKPIIPLGYYKVDDPEVCIPFVDSMDYESFCNTYYTPSALRRRDEKVEVMFIPLSSITEIGGVKYGGE